MCSQSERFFGKIASISLVIPTGCTILFNIICLQIKSALYVDTCHDFSKNYILHRDQHVECATGATSYPNRRRIWQKKRLKEKENLWPAQDSHFVCTARVIVLICVVLLVAVMQGETYYSVSHKMVRSAQVEKSWRIR